MAFHTIVVLITVLYRITAVGHMRDSDILIMLWKAQWVPTVSTVMFLLGTVASMISLLWALVMMTMLGSHCFAGNPSMTWDLWWDEWTGDHRDYPVGRGVAHPDGEYILNPWAQKADELGIVWPCERPFSSYGRCAEKEWGEISKMKEQYDEFLQDHFKFPASCINGGQGYGHMSKNGWKGIGDLCIWISIGLVPFLWVSLFVGPGRATYNYWASDCKGVNQKWYIRYSLQLLSFGFAHVYFFGPFSSWKVNDPYDLTEAWEEFEFRAKVGEVLASKDTSGDGFVDPTEFHSRSMSSKSFEGLDVVESVESLADALADADIEEASVEALTGAGLDVATLKAFAEDGLELVPVLKEVGVASLGDRLKIIKALRGS